MKTVSSRVNEKEFEAITEYANQTGETVSNILKKAVFERAAKSKDGCPEGYRLNRRVHEGMDKEASLAKDVNTIRKVLGWDETSLVQTKSTDVKESKEELKKPTMEGYAAWLRTEKGKENIDELENSVNKQLQVIEELTEQVDRLVAQIEEVEENEKQTTRTVEGHGAWLRKQAAERHDFSG